MIVQVKMRLIQLVKTLVALRMKAGLPKVSQNLVVQVLDSIQQMVGLFD